MNATECEAQKFYLIRHGETAWSLAGRHTGRTDLALTTHGESQARSLVSYLKAIRFSAVLTSPLLRARQTCELAGLGVVSEIEPDLAECDYGDYEGRRSTEICEERPGWTVWREGCPGGETPRQLSDRADRLIGRLIAMQGNVALFSHGQFGSALAARWIGLPMVRGEHFTLDPASVSILGYEPGHSEVRAIALWNRVAAA